MSAVLALICSVVAAMSAAAPQQVSPEQYTVFEPAAALTIVLSGDIPRETVQPLETFFARAGSRVSLMNGLVKMRPRMKDEIHVGIAGQGGAFADRSLHRYAEIAEALPAAGYVLEIRSDCIILSCKDAAGVSNGISRLISWAAQSPRQIPCANIRDWPAAAQRYVRAEGPLSDDALDMLATAGCNGIFFDTDSWADLIGADGQTWRNLFDACRARNIEPIPVVDFLQHAGAYLKRFPAAAAARTRTQEVMLLGEDWAALKHRQLLPAETQPITVAFAGVPMVEGRDFVVDRPPLAYPYPAEGPGALLRRIEGGGIPDGTEVQVTYAYIPEDTESLCLFAPETESAGRAVADALVNGLGASSVHLGFGDCQRWGQDPRIPADASAMRLLHEAARRAASWYAFEGVLPRLYMDQGMLASPRFSEQGDFVPVPGIEVIATAPAVGALMAMPAEATRAQLYAAARQAARAGGGMVVPWAAGEDAVAAALGALWNPEAPGLAWPKVLNAQFGADLWEPDDTARLNALMQHVNRMMLAGQSPAQLAESWSGVERMIAREKPDLQDEVQLSGAHYQTLLDYLSAEARYNAGEREAALKDLERVVRRRGELDPAFAAERMQRILDTMEAQQLFAPGSIVFGEPLCYARPGRTPGPLFEIPATAAYDEDRGMTNVTLDLSPGSAAVARVDFESAGAASLSLELEGRSLWTATGAFPVRGPALVTPPQEASGLRLKGEGPGERVAIREPRLSAAAPPREARCVSLSTEPPLAKLSGRDGLAGTGRAYGLLIAGEPRFAAAQTEVWFLRTPGQWFAYIRAHEPRMDTMVAGGSANAPDDAREEVRIRIRTASGEYTFGVSPGGVRYDLEYNDPAWDSVWSADLARESARWDALIAVPLSEIGGAPRAGESWDVRIERQRRNVVQEDSVWQGPLRFE